MPEITSYAPGTPSWIDLSTPDVEAAKRFYAELLGWEAEDQTQPDAGGYVMFRKGGKSVAGLGPAQPGQPPVWNSYVTVESADTAAAAAKSAGGSIYLEPMDVLDVGRMAVLADPTGAAISIWQPKAHIGSELVNEPGTFCWSELQSRDLAGARKWYEQVLGWECKPMQGGPMEYTQVLLQGEFVAGMMDMPEGAPAELPSYWAIYISVADCAATIAKAAQLGGTLDVGPMEIPPGTTAMLRDPQGASFNVLQFRE